MTTIPDEYLDLLQQKTAFASLAGFPGLGRYGNARNRRHGYGRAYAALCATRNRPWFEPTAMN
jgi:hypothetical protein